MEIASIGNVAASQFIRRMRGKSRAPLIEATDGFLYVVKWLHDPRSANSVRNEALRNSIYEYIGLPVPPWAAIGFSSEFFSSNRHQWLSESPEKLVDGCHFGSRWAGSAEETVFEILPRSWYQRVQNRDTFWGAYVADVWTLRLAPRQAIFVEDHVSGNIRVIFIDHGSNFTVARRGSSTNIETLLYPDRSAYDDSVFTEQIQHWARKIEERGEAAVNAAWSRMPSEWKSASVDAFCAFLIHRISSLSNTLHSTSPSFPAYRYSPERAVQKRAVLFKTGLTAS